MPKTSSNKISKSENATPLQDSWIFFMLLLFAHMNYRSSNLNTWKQNQSAHSFYATEDTAEVVKSYETQRMLLYVLGLFFKVSSPLALENS